MDERHFANFNLLGERQARLEKAIDDLTMIVHRDLEATIRTETQLIGIVGRVERLEATNVRLQSMEQALAVIEAGRQSQRWTTQVLSPTFAAILSAVLTYVLTHQP